MTLILTLTLSVRGPTLDVRFRRLKSIPALKLLNNNYNSRIHPYHTYSNEAERGN